MSKNLSSMLSLTAFLGVVACDSTEPEAERFMALLSGDAEVPPRASTATGRADFTVESDGSVSYTLDVANLGNVVAAHVHGPATLDVNAGVLVTLFTSASPLAGPTTGRLSAGRFSGADQTGAGVPVASMDSILGLMRAGRAYVNVHTNDGIQPINAGPGDFPGGEIRGQIQRR